MTSLLATLGAQSWGFFIGATLPVKVYLNYHLSETLFEIKKSTSIKT